MTALMLDFDGVTHPMHTGSLFSKTPLLWRILRSCPETEVVFSTSWREIHALDVLINFATHGGGEDLASRFIGSTPVLKYDEYEFPREMECRAWLAESDQEHRSWLAIDDMPEWFAPVPNPNLYVVNHKTGLTDGDVEAIIDILRS